MVKSIVTVQRPELTAEERARRMKQIKEAATQLIIATDLAKKKLT
jgi:superfamily II DNA/RNA helicase